jgi:hypothetical protein
LAAARAAVAKVLNVQASPWQERVHKEAQKNSLPHFTDKVLRLDTLEFGRSCAAPGESPKLEWKKPATIPHFPLEDSFQKVS